MIWRPYKNSTIDSQLRIRYNPKVTDRRQSLADSFFLHDMSGHLFPTCFCLSALFFIWLVRRDMIYILHWKMVAKFNKLKNFNCHKLVNISLQLKQTFFFFSLQTSVLFFFSVDLGKSTMSWKSFQVSVHKNATFLSITYGTISLGNVCIS